MFSVIKQTYEPTAQFRFITKRKHNRNWFSTKYYPCKFVCLHSVRNHVQWRDEVTRQFFVSSFPNKEYLSNESTTAPVDNILDT